MSDRQTRAYACAAGAVLLWSTVATAFKLSLRHLSPQELLLWSSLASTLALGLAAACTGRLRELRRWSRQDVLRSVALGFVNPCLYYLVLFEAYSRLPAQEAQAINFAWPLVLVIMSVVVLKQAISGASLAAMAISFAGVAVVATRGRLAHLRLTDPLGVGLALGSTVLWAAYWTGGARDRRDPVVRMLVNFGFGTVFVAALVGPGASWPDLAGLAGAIYVGLFEMGFTYVLWLSALALSETTDRVSGLIYLTPFLSLVFIHFILGEPLYPSTLAGLTLIVTGIGLQRRTIGSRAPVS